MSSKSFGKYLQSLRKKQTPSMTQEQLANAIHRSKMTVSQFESEKNAPPQGELLERIISVLALTTEEKNMLRFLASKTRKTIPNDIENYFFKNPSICKAIRAAQANDKDDLFWNHLSKDISSKTKS